MKLAASATLAIVLSLGAAPVLAQDFTAQVKARQGQFRIMAINLGILGAMAKGETAFDTAALKRAADSLAGVAMVDQTPLWPEGSDNMAIDGTRALPAIWENPADLGAKWAAFGASVPAIQAATDAASLGAAIGATGGTCKACHDANRAPS